MILGDLRDLTKVNDISKIEALAQMLTERVGSSIAFANLASDLGVSSKTVSSWITMLEQLYLFFLVTPYSPKNIARSLSKQPKIYFFDNADVISDAGAKFKNLLATTLLKRLHWLEDYGGKRCRLHYLRDKDGHEVDFLTVIGGKAGLLIEAKLKNDQISKNLRYYAARLAPRRSIQVVAKLDTPYQQDGIEVMSLEYFIQSAEPWAALADQQILP